MSWAADVPFPAEDLGRCRGCDAPIGWVTTERGKPHPVEAKGWAGIALSVPGPAKVGYTITGRFQRVAEPSAETPKSAIVVVFESHFYACPKADRFRRAARGRE